MRIEVTRSGGFAGLVRRGVVDTADLPPEEAERWRALAEAALAAGGGRPPGNSPVRDGFRYEITVDDRVLEADGHDLSPAGRDLATRVLAEGTRA
jgi:hypothetical protein